MSTEDTFDCMSSVMPIVVARFMGPIWGRKGPGGPHVGPLNFAICVTSVTLARTSRNITQHNTHTALHVYNTPPIIEGYFFLSNDILDLCYLLPQETSQWLKVYKTILYFAFHWYHTVYNQSDVFVPYGDSCYIIFYTYNESICINVRMFQHICDESNHSHDDVIKLKRFPRFWPYARGIRRSPVNSPHKGQWRGALMFSLICVWINSWINNREAGDLRRYRAHYDVIVMNILVVEVRHIASVKIHLISFWNMIHVGEVWIFPAFAYLP